MFIWTGSTGSTSLFSNWFHFLILKLHEYRTFGLIKMHNMRKIWFLNNKFSLWKSLVTINGLSKMLFCNLYLLIFTSFPPNFKWLLSKILEWISRVLSKFHYVINIFDLHIFENETAAFLNLWNLHWNAFYFFIFSKRKKHYNLPFDDTFKMCCCALC